MNYDLNTNHLLYNYDEYMHFFMFHGVRLCTRCLSDSDEDVIVQGGLTGNWYSTENGTIYTVEFHKEGTGELVTYTYSSIPDVTGYHTGWTVEGMSF